MCGIAGIAGLNAITHIAKEPDAARIVRRMNEGNSKAAADAFLLWNKAGGKVLKGLTARREDEKKLFLTRST